MADPKTTEPDFLDLPDDELPDYPPEGVFGDPEPEAENAAEEANLTEEDEENDDTLDASLPDETGSDGEETSEEGSPEGDEVSEPGSEASEESESDPEQAGDETQNIPEEEEQQEDLAPQKPAKPAKAKSKADGKVTENEVSIGADDQLKQLFAPFKANGHDMQVGSIDDARTLMQMGANYNKKMAGLKPNLRLIKMLDNNKLLDEEKLSYLIDLNKQDPQAIAKLIKDSGFDPLDQDESTQTAYSPNTYTVNEKEVDLDMVLGDIEDTPSFKETIDAISTKWDAASKQSAIDDPNIIRTINSHMESGMYNQVMDVVLSEKAVGRLTQMSDLEAYKHVGDTLQASGAFNNAPPANVVPNTPKVKAPVDPRLKNRKKAAAPTRSAPAKSKVEFDPLALGDEEFEKMAATLNI